MRQDSFIFFFDIFFSGKILSFFVDHLSKNKRNKKYRIFGFLLSALILLLIHMTYFISQKESNYFELINIPRVFELEELQNRVSYLKKQKKTYFLNNTIRLSQINEILSNTPLKNSYDKFNKRNFDKREEMMSIAQSFQVILYQKVLENLIFYMILTVITIISSDDENSKKSIKWVIATMVGFFFMELNYLFLNNNEHDLIDYIFPFMTISERIQLARDLLMPILFIIKYRYKFFFKDPLFGVKKTLLKCDLSQRSIKGAFENLWGENEDLVKIQKNFEIGLETLNEYIKKKGLEKKKVIDQNKNEDKIRKNDKKQLKTNDNEQLCKEKEINIKKNTNPQTDNTSNQANKPYIADKIKQLLSLFIIGFALYKFIMK